MRRKNNLLLILTLLLITVTSWGAKAISTPIQVQQADGTQLTIFLHGDEYFNWVTTADEVLLVQVGKGYYIASVAKDGTLTATSQLAHEANIRQRTEQDLVASQDKSLFIRNVEGNKNKAKTRSIPIGTPTPPYFPHTGSPKALVLLVEFQDVKFTTSDPIATFKYYLNAQPGDPVPANNDINQSRLHGSVRQYFHEMSQGLFTPQFDVKGVFTMPETSVYYGKGHDDQHYQEMIANACAQADAAGVDFSQYDQNHDGLADLVYIIYAGYGASVSGDDNDLWPKSGAGSFGTYDGVKVARYGINNELNYRANYVPSGSPRYRINGIGLFCHEFSHTLGLPDFYPSNSAAQIDNQALEYWDLMDGGEYVDNGYTPTPYTPWEMEVMGWMNLTELSDAGNYSLQPFDEEHKAYKITSGIENNSEYLILQNIQNNGWWSKMLGKGMLVYRVDYQKGSINIGDYPNNTAGKPGLTIVPADGLLITSYRVYDPETGPTATKPYSREEYNNSHRGDPYPGTSNVTRIESVAVNGGTIKKPIYQITESTDGTISFNFLKEPTPTGIQDIKATGKPKDDKIYTLDGRYVGTNLSGLPKGIYIYQHKKYVVK
ncbi:M6 family metalloprotease domain-containing protein [Prevotella sp. KH2C16]|uniref:M6 family metalloprotease domain-containing protein n=1 Tax=Prevotella sp. KH2C16 TaxID=1855325 RepID=UPI000B85E5A0|nr:M6 family metalloprotease domain-containing protein [Prevotella sp. KH2C16]